MMWKLIFACVFATAFAGRAPYLGEDMQDLIEKTKRSGVTTMEGKTITSEQKKSYEKYNTKFSEIAKAYAEGYKAAIKAVQARAYIAQRRLQQIQPRSFVPQPPPSNTMRQNIQRPAETPVFKSPVPIEVTENGLEKSSIPHPRSLDSPHRMVQRSAVALQNDDRTPARLNYAARHRNVYLDTVGGDPSTGGILERQNVYFTKHRRSLTDKEHVRHRRSRMPYLGQNLDALGIIRVKPNWEKPAKKSVRPAAAVPAPIAPRPVQFQAPPPAPLAPQMYMPASQGIPAAYAAYFRSLYAQQLRQQPVTVQTQKPVYRAAVPQPRAAVPQPYAMQMAQMNSFLARAQPAPRPAQAVAPKQPPASFAHQAPLQVRSYLPTVYPQFPILQYAPQYGKLTSDNSQATGFETQQQNQEAATVKRSASPEPSTEALNYAARHRNVYLDNVSGDPYSGGSTVLSQNNYYRMQ